MRPHIFKEKNFTLLALPHLGALKNTIHLIFDHASNEAVVVDPAWQVDLLIDTATEYGCRISAIWLTHWHPDHTNGTDELVKKTGAKVFVGSNEIPYLNVNAPVNGIDDGEILSIGETRATVMTTPGHSAGSVSYLLPGHLIAGDTLFVYGAGHCALPGADASTCFQTMQRLNQLDDDIILHCGHDYGTEFTTTMAMQKQHNPFLLIDNEADFVRYRNQIHDDTRQYPMAPMTKVDVKQLLATK